ncbi:hypothetical protein CI238_02964, partial [Colletotrichum incanum]
LMVLRSLTRTARFGSCCSPAVTSSQAGAPKTARSACVANQATAVKRSHEVDRDGHESLSSGASPSCQTSATVASHSPSSIAQPN